MPKPLELGNMLKDLEYSIFGTPVHAWLFKIFPPHEGMVTVEPGSGCGKFSLMYALHGCEVYMLDVDPEVVTYARHVRNALNALRGFPLPTSIKIGSIFRMKFSDGFADLVFNEGVPQHFPDEDKRQGAIDQMARVSKNMVAVIGNNGLKAEEQEMDREFEFTYMGMPPHRKCFTPDELEMRLKKAGLRRIQVEGITPGRIEDSVLIGGYGYKH